MTIEPRQDVLELADELEALLSESLTPEAFRTKYRARCQSEAVSHAVLDIIGAVEHFLSDADIRDRDAGYRQMQELEMRRLIDCLRSGMLEVAARISFLRPTEDAK